MTDKRCAHCGRQIPDDRRPDADYCSPRCQHTAKQRRYRFHARNAGDQAVATGGVNQDQFSPVANRSMEFGSPIGE